MRSLQSYIDQVKGNVHLKQASSLFIWNLVAVPINLTINFFLTRYLGAEDYGNYSFVERTFAFFIIIINFGLFRSVGRAVLLSNDEKRKG